MEGKGKETMGGIVDTPVANLANINDLKDVVAWSRKIRYDSYV